MDLKGEIQNIADAIKEKLNIEELIHPVDFDELINSIDFGLKMDKEKNILKEYNILPGSEIQEGDFVKKVKSYLYRQDIVNIPTDDVIQYEVLAADNDKTLLLYCTKKGMLGLSIIDSLYDPITLLLETHVTEISNVIYKNNFLGYNTNEGFSILYLEDTGVIRDFYKDENHILVDFSGEVLIYKDISTNTSYITGLYYDKEEKQILTGREYLLFDILENSTGLKVINVDENLDLYIIFYLDENSKLKYMVFHIDEYIYDTGELSIDTPSQITQILYYDEYIRFYYIVNSQLFCSTYRVNGEILANDFKLEKYETTLYNIQAYAKNILDISWINKRKIISIIYEDYRQDYYHVVLLDEETGEIVEKIYLAKFNEEDDFKFNKNKIAYLKENKIYVNSYFFNKGEYQVAEIKYSDDEIVGIVDLITKNNKVRVYEPKRED